LFRLGAPRDHHQMRSILNFQTRPKTISNLARIGEPGRSAGGRSDGGWLTRVIGTRLMLPNRSCGARDGICQ
jgi:hypothetical protein